MQELMSLREHVLMAVKTGTAQANAAASALEWERLQGAVATMTDKAMYLLVIARTPVCERGGCITVTSQLVIGLHHHIHVLKGTAKTNQKACAWSQMCKPAVWSVSQKTKCA